MNAAAAAVAAVHAAAADPLAEPYGGNWEHLQDELAWLDRLLHLRLLERRGDGQGDGLEPFRGLVISEHEVLRLLSTAAPGASASAEPAAATEAPPPVTSKSGGAAPRRAWALGRRTSAAAPPAAAAPGPARPAGAAELAGAAANAAAAAARERALAAVVEMGGHIAGRRAAGGGAELRLARLSWLFQLDAFEERCVLLCLAPEIDRRYEKLYAFLHDDVTRRAPTVGLMLELLCGTREEALAARQVFAPQATLQRARLLWMGDASPGAGGSGNPATLLARPLKLDDRIAEFLLGADALPASLQHVAAQVLPPAQPPAAGHCGGEAATASGNAVLRRRIAEQIRSRLQGPQPAAAVFYLRGPYGAGKRELVRAVCADLGLMLVAADLGRLAAAPGEAAGGAGEAAWLLAREAVLQPAALCLSGCDRLLADSDATPGPDPLAALGEALRLFSRVTFLLGRQPWTAAASRTLGEAASDAAGGRPGADAFAALAADEAIQTAPPVPAVTEIVLDLPDLPASRALWQRELDRLAAGGAAPEAAADAGALAGRFRFTPGQIRDAAALAAAIAAWRSPEGGGVTVADLFAACRAQTDGKLGQVARKVEARVRWSDLVLPPDPLEQLREICDQARYRHVVLGDWGFARRLSLGKGLNVLFSGPPGTGKTMAAEVIATELDLELYKIDLSQVVSKYIGETEKNLDRVFAAAESASAILFFDEADALFGKRSEVKDSHDRYANVEISYLLQKMEEYQGIAILATNLRQNLDDAFQRRLAFTVHFPFPDEESRRRIWEGAWPPETPLTAGVDAAFLARRFKLAGGNIKNVALAAAFLAAAEHGRVSHAHLLRAVRREMQKLGKTLSEAEVAAP